MFMEVDDKVKIAYYWFSKEEKDDKERGNGGKAAREEVE